MVNYITCFDLKYIYIYILDSLSSTCPPPSPSLLQRLRVTPDDNFTLRSPDKGFVKAMVEVSCTSASLRVSPEVYPSA